MILDTRPKVAGESPGVDQVLRQGAGRQARPGQCT